MFEYLLNRLLKIFDLLSVFVFFPALLCIVIIDVFARNFFDAPMSWTHESSGLLLIVLFFSSLPVCIQKDELVRVDFLISWFGNRFQKWLYRLKYSLLAVFSGLIVWQGGWGMEEAWQYEDQAFSLPIPLWPIHFMIVSIGLILGLQSLLRLFIGPAESVRPLSEEPQS